MDWLAVLTASYTQKQAASNYIKANINKTHQHSKSYPEETNQTQSSKSMI